VPQKNLGHRTPADITDANSQYGRNHHPDPVKPLLFIENLGY